MVDEPRRAPTVFLSYASENRETARRIGAALPAFGLEVWYDESELGGGDAWDQKIRRQIRDCDFFMALVSAQTEARREGYFRREWRLAAERTLDMADDHLFLLPLVIDDTDATHARVPEKFQSVQWLRVPDGQPTPAFEALCRRLAGGDTSAPPPRASIHPGGSVPSAPSPPSQPSERTDGGPFQATPFPLHEPGQNLRYWVEVLGWALRNTYRLYRRLPRWIRWGLMIWIVLALMSRCQSTSSSGNRPRAARDISPATQKKLDQIGSQFQQDPTPKGLKIGELVSKQFGDAAKGDGVTVLAVPFTAPAGDVAAAQLADAAFAQSYTRIAVERHGQLSSGEPGAAGCELKDLLHRGRVQDLQYVLCGTAEAAASAPARLTVTLVDVEGSRVLWHGDYPVAGTEPATIARDVAAHVPLTVSDD